MKNTINSQIIFFKDTCESLMNLLDENISNNFYFNLNKNYSLEQKDKIKNLNEKITDLLNFNFELIDKINTKINDLIVHKKNMKLNFLKKENQFNWNLLLFFEFSFYSNLKIFNSETIYFIYQNTFFSTYFFQFLYIYNLNEIFNSSRDQINLYEKIRDNQLEHLNLYEKSIDKKIDLLNFFKEKNNIFFDFNKVFNEISFSNKQLSLKITYYSYNLFKTINLYDNLFQDFFLDFVSFVELVDLSHTRLKNSNQNSNQLKFINNSLKLNKTEFINKNQNSNQLKFIDNNINSAKLEFINNDQNSNQSKFINNNLNSAKSEFINNNQNSNQLEFINNNQKFDLSLINDNLIFYIDLLENKKREIKGFYKKLNEIRHCYFK